MDLSLEAEKYCGKGRNWKKLVSKVEKNFTVSGVTFTFGFVERLFFKLNSKVVGIVDILRGSRVYSFGEHVGVLGRFVIPPYVCHGLDFVKVDFLDFYWFGFLGVDLLFEEKLGKTRL